MENNQPITSIIGVGDVGKTAAEYVTSILSKQIEEGEVQCAFATDSTSDSEIENMLESKDMAFIISDTAQSALKACSVSKSKGILTIAIILDKSKECDNLISNADCVIEAVDTSAVMNAVSIITDCVYRIGIIGIDFYDVKGVISKAGKVNVAYAKVSNAEELVEHTFASLPENFNTASTRKLLLNINITENEGMVFVDGIMEIFCENLDINCEIIVNCCINMSGTECSIGAIFVS